MQRVLFKQLCILLVLFSFIPIALADPADNLLIYSELEDTTTTILDEKGNLNGNISGTYTQSATGIIEDGIICTDALIAYPDGNWTDLTTAFSIQAWVYPTSSPSDMSISAKGGAASASSNMYELYWKNADTISGVVCSASTCHTITTTGTYSLNAWHHVVLTYDGSATDVTLYVDGVQVASNNATHSSLNNVAYPLQFCREDAYFPLKGTIDEVGIWNTALTQADVTTLYNSGSAYRPIGGDTPSLNVTWITPADADAIVNTNTTFVYYFNTSVIGNVTSVNATLWWNNTEYSSITNQAINSTLSFSVPVSAPLVENISSIIQVWTNEENLTINTSTTYVFFNVTSPTTFNSNISSYTGTYSTNFTVLMNWSQFTRVNECGVVTNSSLFSCTTENVNITYVSYSDNSMYNNTAPSGQYNLVKTWNISGTYVDYVNGFGYANSGFANYGSRYLYEFVFNNGSRINSSILKGSHNSWGHNNSYNPFYNESLDSVNLFIYLDGSDNGFNFTNFSVYAYNLTDQEYISSCTIESMIDEVVEATAYCTNETENLNLSTSFTMRNVNYINFTAISALSGSNISDFSIIYSQGTFNASGISLLIRNWINYTENYTYYHPDSVAISAAELYTNTSIQQYQFLVYTVNSINFTFRDHVNQSLIDNKNITIELISTPFAGNYSTSDGYLYLDLLTPTQYTFRFSADNYSENFYFFELENRTTSNITLYMIREDQGTEITVTVYDNTNTLIPGTYIKYLRYYLTSNSYETVGMAETDSSGQAKLNLQLNSEFYRFQLNNPFDTIRLTSNPSYVFETNLNFQINLNQDIGQYFHNFKDIYYNLTYNNDTSNFRFEWIDTDGLAQEVTVEVYQITPYGKELYNSSNVNSTSGVILVYAPPVNNTQYQADVLIRFNPEVYVTSLIVSNIAENPIGSYALFGLVIVSGVATLAIAPFSAALAVILLPTPWLIGSVINLISIHWSSFLALQIIALFIAFIIERNRV